MNSVFDRFRQWTQRSISLRIFSIAFLVLLLMIPTDMVRDLIREREYRRSEAVTEISSTWSGEQTIVGPFLTIPYEVYFTNKDGEVFHNTKFAHFLPEYIDIDSELEPEIRYRGMYEAVLYSSTHRIQGSWEVPDFESFKVNPENVHWEDAVLSVGITDLRGIRKQVQVKVDGKDYTFNPGLLTKDLAGSGISARLDWGDSPDQKLDFQLALELNGSQGIQFAPVGKKTEVNLQGRWHSPKFDGAFLPDQRNISDSSFQANWEVLHLNRNFPQQWLGNNHNVNGSYFGTSLIVPVDQYLKTERSVKYALMLIALTFLVFFFVEIINKQRIHPVQYTLVGLALVVFYVLLLSLSEQIGFDKAFLTASGSVIVLITSYVKGILKDTKITAMTAGLLIIMYGFVYIVMQLEDYALLFGSIWLFIILGVVMWITRRIDWYGFSQTNNNA